MSVATALNCLLTDGVWPSLRMPSASLEFDVESTSELWTSVILYPWRARKGHRTCSFHRMASGLAFNKGNRSRRCPWPEEIPAVLIENLSLPNPNWGPPGISWGDGSIVFPRALGEGLSIIPDTGGEPKEFTTLDTAAHEASHRLPHFLPDGSAVLFTVIRYTTVTPNWKLAQVWVKPSRDGERKLLLDDALDARYANNSLVFARQGKLYAVGFDAATLTVTGTPVQVLDGVTHATHGVAAVTWSGAAQFSVSTNGTLMYAPGSIEPPLLSSLLWVDRTGKVTPVPGMKPMYRFAARVSPDGKKSPPASFT